MRIRLPLVLGLAALLVTAAVVAQGRSAVSVGESRPLFGAVWLPTIPLPAGDPPPPPSERVDEADSADQTSLAGDLTGRLIVALPIVLLCLALLVGLVGAVRRRRIGAAAPTAPMEDDQAGEHRAATSARLLVAARAASEQLRERTGGSPADAVVAAWLRLEQAAAGAGTRRLPHQTPTEFAAAVLAEHTTNEPALEDLRVRYERARFGLPNQTTAADAAAARAALGQIMRALAAQRVGGR
jgi:Na+-transporting methylmalonyl-CoA/oxaloacetate decarboxylase gamma subunit